MSDSGIVQQMMSMRAQAEKLVAQLGADPAIAAPFLQAVTALEQRMLNGHTLMDAEIVSSITTQQATALPANSTDRRNGYADALRQAEAQCAQFQQVLMESPIGVCILYGADQTYTFTNPIYDQVVGRTDMVGKTVSDLFPEIAGQGIYELLDQVYTTGVPFTTREIMIQFARHGTGVLKDVYFDLTYRPLWAADGAITGVVAYVLDISDRRALDKERAQVLQLTQEAQYTIEAERQRLLSVLRQAPAAICTLEGPEHVFTFTNPAYDRLAGRQDLAGQEIRAALPELEGQSFFELLDGVYATGAPFVGSEVPVQLDRHATGALEQAFVNFVCAPLRDASEMITGIFVQAVDVSELVKARQQADAAVVVRDQFLSIAAHELKTPLTALIGYVQLLNRRMRRAGELDERTDRTLAMIGTQSQRLTRLIDVLMDVARINLGHLTLEHTLLDLGALTTHVVDELNVMLEHRAIQVIVPPQPCRMEGDSLRLEQVIVNLVQNAIKYSPEGSAIQVTVGCTVYQAWLSVRDWGLGMSAASLPHLFERFYRVPESAARFVSGMGIGLSVVNEIVTLHGGTINVESTEGVGSTFTVWLPLTKAGESRRN